MSSKKEVYGKIWPSEMGQSLIELWCWANYEKLKEPENERWRHLKNSIILIDKEMRDGWNDWTEMMCWAYGSYPYVAAMGCTASTKTHTIHKLGIYDYMSSPLKTTMTCTTTNAAGLEQRMWPVVSSSFQYLKKTGLVSDWKMTVAPQRMVRPQDGETKHVIRAVTIDPKADKEKIVDQLIGVHPKRRIWVVDEATSAPQAILDAWPNAMAATEHKRLCMLGNPFDYADALATFCKPIGGWDSVTEEIETWEFQFMGEKGIGLHFRGVNSPNIKKGLNEKGKERWPFMYGHKDHAAMQSIRESNPIQYWRMSEGWFMPEGVSRRVCSMAQIDRFKCKDHFTFKGNDMKRFASLDPSSGGDRCTFKIWKMGTDTDLKMTVMDQEGAWEIPIDPRGLPGEQIGQFCLEKCTEYGVDTIGIDTTTNNSASAEWLTLHSSLKVVWIPFGGAASDERSVSESDSRTCKEAYYNKAAELWFSVSNHLKIIRGLEHETCVELCSRYWEPVGDKPTRQRIETKSEYKDRMKKSPDHADNVVIAFETFRQLGGLNLAPSSKKSTAWNDRVKKLNSIYSSDLAYK